MLIPVKVCILGAGNIGRALEWMMRSIPTEEISIVDKQEISFKYTKSDPILENNFHVIDVTNEKKLENFIKDYNVVVSALPFNLNKLIAKICSKLNISYFDFTEDTETTEYIKKLAKNSNVTFMPQCGLAPGAINIITAGLINGFNGQVKSASLRVGALPLTTTNQMRYYLSWNAAGVVNEYIQECDALFNKKHIKTQALCDLETIVIDGVEYECFNTSGGIATMCETYLNKVDNLNYKTIRYRGHCDHMRFLFNDLNLRNNPDFVESLFNQEVPSTEDDVVIFYTSVVGYDDNRLINRTYVRKIKPIIDPGFSAIQISTAAGMAAILELFIKGKIKNGFVTQESVNMSDFLSSYWGERVYGFQAPKDYDNIV